MSESHFSVGESAREVGCGCRPRDISDAFYNGDLDDGKILFVAGRRAIPESYLPVVKETLARLGKIKLKPWRETIGSGPERGNR